ncbi:platelet-activating factor acetylhydrolase IB subunit alpha1-like [Oppia nitens]|uniref:platelet-activating factor acetylhydrolase IB subunit alpha1-like n=1 Tax=Oppia nitens TaxID=1686743 RepID=UPI0023D9A80C|nr:platelet-activating factor acetylhydrolase IB subunit alpha1-like [Oppia nitens]
MDHGANLCKPEANIDFGDYWLEIHESFVRQSRDRKDDIKVVFIGASIVQNWSAEGLHIWRQYYAPKGAVNYGIGGDTIQNVLWRVQNKSLDGLDPRVIVLQCGANNLLTSYDSVSDDDIARGICAIINELSSRLPNANILCVGITPINDRNFLGRAKRVNELVANKANERNILFLDLIPKMCDSSNGQPIGRLFTDGLHLTRQGYDVWHEAMQPLFERLY